MRQQTLTTGDIERFGKPTYRERFLAEIDQVFAGLLLCALFGLSACGQMGPNDSRVHVPASFPTQEDEWTAYCDDVMLPYPGRPMSVAHDEVTGLWHAMGHVWNTKDPDKPNYGIVEQQYVFVSPDGLGDWSEVPGNPVIKYDAQFAPRDYDNYVNSPAYARNPDGSLAKHEGKWVVAVVNFDGKDSHIQILMSQDGISWVERTTLWSGTETKTPPGSGDPGEQWVNSFIHNPDDGKWYLFYHGGGNNQRASEPGARTIGVAIGSSPLELVPWKGEFRDGRQVTQGPNVLRDAAGWLMVYGHGSKDHHGLRLARSFDLKHWTPTAAFLAGNTSIRDLVVDVQDKSVEWRIYGRRDRQECIFRAFVPRAY